MTLQRPARLTYALLIGLLASALAACSAPPPGEQNHHEPHPLVSELPVSERTFRIGVSGFIPRNYQSADDADWQDLFDRIPEYGELFGVHTGWNEGDRDADGIPTVITLAYNITAGTETEPYVALGVEPDRLTQQEADTYFHVHGDEFRSVAVAIAERHRPDILLLGVEINRLYERSEAGFSGFVDVYLETYEAIKAVSPETRVGSNFLLEYMMGAGAISGQEHEEHWEILQRFDDRMDIVTFTVFPFMDYADPRDIPADYLNVIQEHTDRPILITETGWPSQDIAGIRGDEDAQVVFLKWLLEATSDLSVDGIVWVYPHDHELGLAGGLFDHVSTRAYGGDAKAVYEYWQAVRTLPLNP